jgi:cytochrome c peroxidase
LETQNIDGLQVHRITIEKDLLDELGYTAMYDEAFSDVEEENRYSLITTSQAISAYLRTVLSDEAPFQKWLKGDERAMSVSEKEGAALFFGKARCANCHYRPNLGSLEFHALGVKDMYQSPSFDTAESDKRNLGRGGFTLNEEDNYKFKVPQLYNMDDAPFFFHGASKRTLEEVIDYKIEAVSENPVVPNDRLSSVFRAINLSEEERSNLLLFLKTSLKDPNLERYMPAEVLSGQCFPNNDPQSIMDLGCS